MSSRFVYSVAEGELTIRQEDEAVVRWRGKPRNINVKEVLPLGDSDDCLVLLDWREAAEISRSNLIRIGPDGSVKWEVAVPRERVLGIDRSSDVYVAVKLQGTRVLANSFLGFLDHIDLLTGRVVESIFVK